MKLRIWLAGLFCSLIAGCQTVDESQIWLRTDGASQSGNPSFAKKFEIDRTICIGETQKAGVGAPIVYSNGSLTSQVSAAIVSSQQSSALNDVMRGCMAQRGYVLVPKDKAAAIAAQYRQQ